MKRLLARESISKILTLGLVSAFSYGAELEVIRKVPHSGYSEGLHMKNGDLWHALPTSLVKIDPKDGTILGRYNAATAYSESIVWVKNTLYNVSYTDNGLYAGTLKGNAFTYKKIGEVPEKHAWGIEYDGKHLIVTGNYSSKLYFLDPKTAKVVRTITTPMKDLEDLAWDGTGIWTSSFSTLKGSIFRVNPKTGEVGEVFSLPNPEECPIIDGIAFDGKGLWITGKECPSLFYVKRPSERQIAAQAKKAEASVEPVAPKDEWSGK